MIHTQSVKQRQHVSSLPFISFAKAKPTTTTSSHERGGKKMLACRFCRWVATRHRRVTSTGGDQWSTSVCGVRRQQGQVSGCNAWGEKLQMRSLNEGSCQRRDTVALLRRRRRGNSVWEVCVNAHISNAIHTGYLQPQNPWESFQLWQNHEKSRRLLPLEWRRYSRDKSQKVWCLLKIPRKTWRRYCRC